MFLSPLGRGSFRRCAAGHTLTESCFTGFVTTHRNQNITIHFGTLSASECASAFGRQQSTAVRACRSASNVAAGLIVGGHHEHSDSIHQHLGSQSSTSAREGNDHDQPRGKGSDARGGTQVQAAGLGQPQAAQADEALDERRKGEAGTPQPFAGPRKSKSTPSSACSTVL
jgi:hypothetical protein